MTASHQGSGEVSATTHAPQPTKQPDLIFDVGLHKGEDTDFYLKKGFRVVAFEADPGLAAHCRDRFWSAIEEGRLVIVEGAIMAPSVEAGQTNSVTFYRNLDLSVWGTTQESWAQRNEQLGTRVEEIQVTRVNFSEALAKHGIPYFLKIDIEGCDGLCLDALTNFDEKPDYLSIESDKKNLFLVAREIDTLRALGYTGFAAVQQGNVQDQRIPLPPLEGNPIAHSFPFGSSGLFGRELPEPWLDESRILWKYRRIFVGYRLFGDDSWFGRSAMGRKLLHFIERLTERKIPGWYDTHARLALSTRSKS